MNLLLRFLSKCFFLLWFVAGNSFTENITYRSSCSTNSDPVRDDYKSTVDFIESNGYVAETHSVTTDDGYILMLHRIPGKQMKCACNDVNQPHEWMRSKVKEPKRPAVLLQHGILGTSDHWLLTGKNSFPFLLVQNGYDVWLGNTRGNRYSQKHVKLFTDSSDYWNFSFHEQGYFDLAAMTDYVLNATGQKKIFFVGHSRGATMSFILLSQRPEYNKKFHLVVSYSPVAYLKHARSSIMRLVFRSISLDDTQYMGRNFRSLSVPEINPKRSFNIFCSRGSARHSFCMNLISTIAGHNRELLLSGLIPIIVAHFPDSASVKEFLHYIQVNKAAGETSGRKLPKDKFQPYDYGSYANMKIYGRWEPPEYNLENITAPIVLFYSQNDFVVGTQDVDRLHSRLKSVILKQEVPFEKFNHVDFIWSDRAVPLIYKPTIDLMNRFRQKEKKNIR